MLGPLFVLVGEADRWRSIDCCEEGLPGGHHQPHVVDSSGISHEKHQNHALTARTVFSWTTHDCWGRRESQAQRPERTRESRAVYWREPGPAVKLEYK